MCNETIILLISRAHFNIQHEKPEMTIERIREIRIQRSSMKFCELDVSFTFEIYSSSSSSLVVPLQPYITTVPRPSKAVIKHPVKAAIALPVQPVSRYGISFGSDAKSVVCVKRKIKGWDLSLHLRELRYERHQERSRLLKRLTELTPPAFPVTLFPLAMHCWLM